MARTHRSRNGVAPSKAQVLRPQVLQGGEGVSLISEFGQPELQYSRLGDPLHLGLAWLVTEPFGWVFKPILEAEFPDNSEPGLRVGIGGGIDVSCQDSQGVDPSSQSTQLAKNC